MAEGDPVPERELTELERELEAAGVRSTNFEFIDRVPTQDEVHRLLDHLESWYGVMPLRFKDYVQALPSTKKVKVPRPTGGKEERHYEVYTLYMSVAGRIQILRAAQEINHWLVEVEPDVRVPAGNPPGYLSWGFGEKDRLVYRVHVKIWTMAPELSQVSDDDKPRWLPFRTATGTAWVPATGGRQAAGSNPFEKVETSALGRALGQLGIGVLPGSGVASLEEMLGARENGAALEALQQEVESGGATSREEVIQEILAIVEDGRQADPDSPEMQQWAIKWVSYLQKTFNVDAAGRNAAGEIDSLDFGKIRETGRLILIRNNLREAKEKAAAERERERRDAEGGQASP